MHHVLVTVESGNDESSGASVISVLHVHVSGVLLVRDEQGGGVAVSLGDVVKETLL